MSLSENQFTPYNPFKGRTQSVVNIGWNGLCFNMVTADVLRRAPYVRILLNADTKQLAVQTASKLDIQSTRFFRPNTFKGKPIKINSRSMVRLIRETAGWPDDETWNVAGIYSAEDNAIIYNLDSAYRPSSRGGWSSGRQTRRR